MTEDGRDIIEVLQEELSFIEKGGYGRSVRTPWLAKSIFQDSLTCLNYGYPYHAHPCVECHLLDFVAIEDRSKTVPCHYITLDQRGHTIEELESEGNELRVQTLVGEWLRTQIKRIQTERSQNSGRNVE